jgi:hypothetical protein
VTRSRDERGSLAVLLREQRAVIDRAVASSYWALEDVDEIDLDELSWALDRIAARLSVIDHSGDPAPPIPVLELGHNGRKRKSIDPPGAWPAETESGGSAGFARSAVRGNAVAGDSNHDTVSDAGPGPVARGALPGPASRQRSVRARCAATSTGTLPRLELRPGWRLAIAAAAWLLTRRRRRSSST